MRIHSISIQNYRCIKDEKMDCDLLTAMVGRNGSGKSTFLHALNNFYNPNADVKIEDFYSDETTNPISIKVSFSDLTDNEKEVCVDYLNDNNISVEKIISWQNNKPIQKYYGYKLGCKSFINIRNADSVAEKRTKYNELIQIEPFRDLPDLPGNVSGARIEDTLIQWEKAHPEKLSRIQDNGDTFGLKDTDKIKIDRYTRYVLIPALRDASQDAIERRGSPITEIMDIVIRNALESQADYKRLQEETTIGYKRIVAPEGGLSKLTRLEEDLKKKMTQFAPESNLYIKWDPNQEIILPQPTATIELEEEGYRTTVDRVGHGLQRAFIWSMLQQLTVTQFTFDSSQELTEISQELIADDGTPEIMNLPTLVLAIEEVELYQHPTRQRYLAKMLLALVQNPDGNTQPIQIIYSTHSPLFIDLERFYQIRILRRELSTGSEAKITKVYKASKDIFSTQGEFIRLKTLMTPWTNEGFFAKMVVLVEGEEDRAALLGTASLKNIDIESKDIAIIPCTGKNNLPKAYRIFNAFKIPVFTVWDGDKDLHERGKTSEAGPDKNRELLRLNGTTEIDFPDTMVNINCACFKDNLTITTRDEIGPVLYRQLLNDIKLEYGIQQDIDVRKNPMVIADLFKRAQDQEKIPITLINIVDKIIEKIGGI